METFILLGPSIASGVLIGFVAKRLLPFVALIFIVPIVIAGGIYFADHILMQTKLGRTYGESWAGLVIPFLSAGSFIFLAPTAIGVAGIKWILARKRKKSGQHG